MKHEEAITVLAEWLKNYAAKYPKNKKFIAKMQNAINAIIEWLNAVDQDKHVEAKLRTILMTVSDYLRPEIKSKLQYWAIAEAIDIEDADWLCQLVNEMPVDYFVNYSNEDYYLWKKRMRIKEVETELSEWYKLLAAETEYKQLTALLGHKYDKLIKISDELIKFITRQITLANKEIEMLRWFINDYKQINLFIHKKESDGSLFVGKY